VHRLPAWPGRSSAASTRSSIQRAAAIRLVLDAYLALTCLPFSSTSAAEGTLSLSMVVALLRMFFIPVEVHE
jgi:hypothetical protein